MAGAQVQDMGRATRRVWLRITLVALLVLLAGLVAVTLAFVWAAQVAQESVGEQAQLSTRLRELQGVLVALVDSESAELAFLITGDPARLVSYRAAVGRLPLLMTGLEPRGSALARADVAAGDARLAISDNWRNWPRP